MGRTSPPAAIIAPPLITVVTQTNKVPDLPLRHFTSPNVPTAPKDHEIPPTPPESTPGLTEIETLGSATTAALPTPSSIAVELDGQHDIFDEDDEEQEEVADLPKPRAIDLAAEVSRAYGRSRSQSAHSDARSNSRSVSRSTTRRPRSPVRGTRSPAQDPRSPSSGSVRTATGTPVAARSQTPGARSHTPASATSGKHWPSARSQSSQGRALDSHLKEDPLERCKRYVQAVVPVDGTKELLLENTSLQQRIAGLQRTERDLLAENHDLFHRISSLERRYEAKRRRWKEQFQEREKAFQARIQALEGRIAEQDEELQRQKQVSEPKAPLVTDDEIVEWFSERTRAWQDWADEFAHHDPDRLKTGLLPVQTLELCESVKTFIQLNDGGLPDELVNSDGGGVKAAQVLLHGMIANFIIEETMQSPFWMFDVLSNSANDLDSPSVVHANSPIGFRVELALWSSARPPRSARLPPKAAMLVKEPLTARRLPPASAVPNLSLNTAGLGGPPAPDFPRRKDLENLYQLLSNVQNNNHEMHTWRAQMIRILSEGGLSLEPEQLKGEDRRRLADARKTYAKKLKDRFLSGAARFLLQDQDELSGIDRLESRLVKEFDLALRFSCAVWSRPDPLRIKGLKDLAGTVFVGSSGTMELCETQAPTSAHPENEPEAGDMPPGYHDGKKVVMAVQPVIEFVSLVDSSGDQEVSKILSKARVLVAAPNNAPSGPQKTTLESELDRLAKEHSSPAVLAAASALAASSVTEKTEKAASTNPWAPEAPEAEDKAPPAPPKDSVVQPGPRGRSKSPKAPLQQPTSHPELLPNTSYQPPRAS